MKKNLLLFTLVLGLFASMANAQDTTLAVFDDGVLDWNSWGAPHGIIANHDMMHNNTDSVLLLDQTGGAWSGVARFSDVPVLDSTVVAVAVDAYFKNSGGTLKFHADNSVSGAANIEVFTDVEANVWTEVIFDLSDVDTIDHKQIAFQSGVADSLLLDNIRLLKAVPEDPMNLVMGGGMENAAAWNFYFGTNGTANVGSHQFNYTADTAAYGEGGSYYVSGSLQTATMLWQPVTLEPNHIYEFTGSFKNVAEDSISEVWIELLLKKTMPDGGEVTSAGEGEFGYMESTWNGPELLNVDTTFQDYITFTGGVNSSEFILPADAQTEWYLVIKAGSWANAGYEPTFEFLIDNISLVDKGINTELMIENVIVGTVDGPEDYTAVVDITWDADSVYMVYDIVDDSIVNEGASYQVDNLEIYFDMDNSKNIHWPRNEGWQQAVDEAFDDNDYQLRLVPDVDYAVNNAARPSLVDGARQVYTETEDGYMFNLHIAWESLLAGFDASVGTVIGFDVLASDNDAVASDANRNQITWNSRTDKPYNDPSLWGMLTLDEEMAFTPVFDTEVPTAPGNLAADDAGTTITWDASTDNIAVLTYIVYDGSTAVDTLWALEADNDYSFADLAEGEHTLGVVATDNSGHKSEMSTVDVTIVIISVEDNKLDYFSVYPNPSTGIVNIETTSSAVASLEVYNMTGKLIMTREFTRNYRLDLSDVNNGMYLIYLKTEEGIQVEKLMLQ